VRVRVIFDAIGSLTSSDALFDEMRNAGVLVKEFNPLSFHSVAFWKFNNRDHRKLLIVDGKIAFTGGLNISGTYASKSSLHPGPERGINEGWRDTDAQIEGPAVRLFQMIFFETWAALDGEMNDSKDIDYPPLENAGADIVSAVASTGVKQRKEPIYSTYLAAIQHASKQVWITQAYFSPPPELRDALIAAVSRGVDVRVLVPSFTDSSIVFYAARGGYEPLLKHGVRLYEVTDALLHAKTAVIDGSVSIIGSANFDYRSFLHNNEVTAIIVSESLGTRMQEIYLSDLQQSKEIDINTWRRRSAGEKLKESASRLINYWL
jgi:cardiolipin synthase